MSYMANRDHIAITSRDASTTRRKVFVPGCFATHLSLTVSLATLIVASRRFPEIVPGNCPPGWPGTQFAISYSANARHRPWARLYMATASSRSPGSAEPAVGSIRPVGQQAAQPGLPRANVDDAVGAAEVSVLALPIGHHDLGGRDRPLQGLGLLDG